MALTNEFRERDFQWNMTAYNGLYELIEDNYLFDDPLSKSLLGWGKNILKVEPSQKKEFQKFWNQMDQPIKHLAFEILVDPLSLQEDNGPKTLNVPVLFRKRVWEEWRLKECYQLWNRSPYDGEPIHEGSEPFQPQPHFLAGKFIQWMKDNHLEISSSLESKPIETSTDVVLQSVNSEISSNLEIEKLLSYIQKAQYALHFEQSQSTSKKYAILSQINNEFTLQMNQNLNAQKKIGQNRSDNHEQLLKISTEQLKKNQEIAAKILQPQLDYTTSNVNESFKNRNNAQDAVQKLQQQLAALKK